MAARITSSSGGVCGASVSSIETSVMNARPARLPVHVAVNRARLLHRSTGTCPRSRRWLRGSIVKGASMPGMLDRARPVPDGARGTPRRDRHRRGLPDGRGHVERVEIAGVDEAVHGAEIDVVGVHVIGPRPAQLAAPPHRRRRARWPVPSPRCRARDSICSRPG